MGGLTSAVDWWEEWQLRVLVLSSLAVQFLLVIFSLLRRRAIPGWVRFTLWLAYLAGDAVSIYALATLFNRHKTDQDNGGRSSRMLLEVVWAPVLLLHLGGQDGISAYNIEDNELWSRHLLTAVSQVTVAIYVFCKTWPPGGGDKKLLHAAIVLFVPGVLKCFHKPWALKSASIYSLVSSSAAVIQKEGEKMYPTLEEYVEGAKKLLVGEQTEEGEAQAARASSFMEDEGRRRPRRNVMEMEPAAGTARGIASPERRQRIREMLQGHNETSKLFVDLSSSYSRRLGILQEFLGLTGKRAYGSVRQGLATAFLLLYTKLKTVSLMDNHDFEKSDIRTQVNSLFSSPTQLSRLVLPWAAIGLFHRSHREAYNDIDVKITYVLLFCTAALEYSSIDYFSKFALLVLSTPTGGAGEQWPEMVSQYRFIGYFARDIKHSKMMRFVSLLGFKDFLDQHWCMKSCFSSARISELVLRYLKDGWREKIKDAASYRRFNNHRSSEGLSLSLSIKREKQPLLFDDSVLLWHIATDFCFFSSSSSSSDDHAEVLCRQMSNYMAYLLFVNPEMLLPGSRRYLFTAARQELEAIFKDEKPPFEETELTRKITSKLKLGSSSQAEAGPESIIQEAWMLAQKLQSLGDEKKMWKVIQDVWVEMLCFSASRCRGYLHAKALGKGGEFLSYVWLLLFHMGMETFADKLQREEEEAGNNAAATTAPSTSERVSSTTTGAGAPSTSSDVHTASAGAAAAPSTSEICIWLN